jgi:hypothetical protein
LLLCSSYLPLGVPSWADIYTPSPLQKFTVEMIEPEKFIVSTYLELGLLGG